MPIKNFDKVELLLPMTGANNGTVFTDYSLRQLPVVRSGSVLPVTSTAQSKFGAYGSSARFPANTSGAPSHLQVIPPAVLTQTFAIQFWFFAANTDGARVAFDTRYNNNFSGGVGGDQSGFRVNISTQVDVVFSLNNGTTEIEIRGGAWAVGEWNHVLVGRGTANDCRLFVNGLLVGNETCNYNFPYGHMTIGGISNSLNRIEHFQQDFYFAIGEEPPTANFTPPARMTQRELTRVNTGTDSHEFDRAILFDWNAGGNSVSHAVTPDASGDFVADDLIDLEYGVAFIKDGCGPECRGPVEVDADA
jgi:hypothetical protein